VRKLSTLSSNPWSALEGVVQTCCLWRSDAAAVRGTGLGAWAATATLQQKRDLLRNCSDKSDASTAALLEQILDATVR
jgi:hypothetical protein